MFVRGSLAVQHGGRPLILLPPHPSLTRVLPPATALAHGLSRNLHPPGGTNSDYFLPWPRVDQRVVQVWPA
ncbi:hypothetical protein E2C01_094001 [Portunus trituberculatus]|uniref:Uncharacterized protein n=1 Tax=Portunus trituberculatus TaxID=210409 RepID=A0A5B7JZN7_PORTR|nr:hypothetical protein [Portunus trituberculatus]